LRNFATRFAFSLDKSEKSAQPSSASKSMTGIKQHLPFA
jgi:hypothetical protein